MAERVVDAGLDVVWDPNVENARLLVDDGKATASLLLFARVDDPDQREVLLTWDGVRSARMEGPNDEAQDGHPLHEAGLGDILWIGEVIDSSLIADLERRNSVHSRHDPARFAALRHWVLPLKGCVVEVVGRSISVGRTS